MLKQSCKNLQELVNSIPLDAKVIDIGGAAAPFARANYIIDIQPYESIHWDRAKGRGEGKIKKENYTKQDICSRKPWPFPDNFFDFSFCSHTLEDIRDPIWVCSEIIRISKAGYIEIPSRIYEQTFGIEAKGLAGNCHHRWIIDIFEGKLRFTFKYFYVHSKYLNKQKKEKDKEKSVLKLEWQDSFEFSENWLNSGKEIFEYFLNRKIDDREMWKLYRQTQDRNFFIKWAAYFKNVSLWLKN